MTKGTQLRSRKKRQLAVAIALVGTILGGAAAGAAQNSGTNRTKAPGITATTTIVPDPPNPGGGITPAGGIKATDDTKAIDDTPVVPVEAGTVPDDVSPEAPVVDDAAGFTTTTMTDAMYDEQFDALAADASLRSASAPTVPKTGKVVSVSTFAGLKNAGLPAWAQLDALNELGYDSWVDVPAAKMNDKIPQTAYNFDAMALHEFVEANPAPGMVAERGWCDVVWDQKTLGATKTIDRKDTAFNINKPDEASWWKLHASVTGYILGEAKYEIKYSLKKRSCIGIPYGARLDSAKLETSLAVGAQALLEANAEKKWQTDFSHKFVPFQYGYKANVGPFVFDLSASADITLGVKLEAEIKAKLKARVNMEGVVEYGWTCVSTSCTQTTAKRDLRTTVSDDTEASLNINFAVIPYIEIGVQVGVQLIVPIARARVAIVAALPVRLHFAACLADLDGNGTFEDSFGVFVDVSLELYAYYWWEVFGKNGFGGIDLPIGDWKRVDVPATKENMYTSYPGHDAPNTPGVIITKTMKSFYNKGLFSGSNNVLRPVVRQLKAGIKVRPQGCYPFTGIPKYEIDLGNGGPTVQSPAGVYGHTFTAPATVKVRIIGDNIGRTLTSEWVSINVIKSSDVIDPTDQIDPGTVNTVTKEFKVGASMTATRQGSSISAQATIKVTDKNDNPIPNATVNGNWTGVTFGSTFGTTNASGIATIGAVVMTQPGTMKFTVTAVEANGFGKMTGETVTSVDVSNSSQSTWNGSSSNSLWSGTSTSNVWMGGIREEWEHVQTDTGAKLKVIITASPRSSNGSINWRVEYHFTKGTLKPGTVSGRKWAVKVSVGDNVQYGLSGTVGLKGIGEIGGNATWTAEKLMKEYAVDLNSNTDSGEGVIVDEWMWNGFGDLYSPPVIEMSAEALYAGYYNRIFGHT